MSEQQQRGWVRRRGVLVHVGTFSEPTDAELTPYAWSAKPLEERMYPSCARPGGRTAHERRGEEPCDDCLSVNAAYHTARKQDARARARGQTAPQEPALTA